MSSQQPPIIPASIAGAGILAGLIAQFVAWFKVDFLKVFGITIETRLWQIAYRTEESSISASWYSDMACEATCPGEAFIYSAPPLLLGSLVIALAAGILLMMRYTKPYTTRPVAAFMILSGVVALVSGVLHTIGAYRILDVKEFDMGLVPQAGIFLVGLCGILLLVAGILLFRMKAPTGQIKA